MIMAKKSSHSRIKPIVYTLMAFILSVIIFAISICTTLEMTLLNSSFVLDNMNSSHYFSEKRDEITRQLVDLGYASGLEESFFDGFLDEIMLNNNTQEYLENYYSGNGTRIDTTEFEQRFNAALDSYIEEKNIKKVDASSREYLVDQAARIYRTSLEIPLFSRLSAYFLTMKNAMPYVIVGLAVLGAVICLVIIFTNYWKHRAVRYISFATLGAFLSIGIIPAVILISGKVNNINLSSRALYNLFVQCANSMLITLLFCALLFMLISAALIIQYKYLRRKVSG